MAKYKSLFEVRGDVGDAGFRLVNGQMVLGRTTSLDRNRLRNDPAFERTRENQKEFGASGKASSALRLGLAEAMTRFADSRVTSRFTKVFRDMLGAGPGLRGQRTIEIQSQKSKLIGLELQVNERVMRSLMLVPDLTVNVDRNTVTLNLPVFSAGDKVLAPIGATHFKISLAIAAISDFEYDPAEKKHVPVNPDLNGLGKLVSSAEIGVRETLNAPLALMASLPNLPILGLSEGLVALVGIEFFQDVNGILSVLKDKSAMHVVDVF